MCAHRHGARIAVVCAMALACDRSAATDEAGGSSSSSTGDGPVHTVPVDVVGPELWLPDLAGDPVPMHQPPAIDCALGYKDEFGVFEVDTGLCNYGVFVQPALAEIYAGDQLDIVITHDDLLAPEPTEGHVAIAIGDRLVFESWVPIPKPYGLVQGQWLADVAIPAGTPVVMHLHNHGYNSWRLVSIRARTP